jgi:CheY-like chemotaxis protein
MHRSPDANSRRGDHSGEVISAARHQATRVLLVDRAGFARSTVAGLLSSISGVALVGESDGDELGEVLATTRPDLLVVDDRLLETVRSTGGADALRLIVVGADDDPGYAARAARAGAEAWVEKDRADAILSKLLASPGAVSSPDPGPVRRPLAALGSAR